MNCCHSELASTVGSSAGYQCPSRGSNSRQKPGKTADSIEGHSVVFYSASFGASRKIERAE